MTVTEYMKANLLYLDGGMGTILQSEGLAPGEFPEVWNITRPDVISKIHCSYFEAGSNVVSTNTFGANCLKFSDEDLNKIIKSAVANAKKARDNSSGNHDKFIALDIGPTGKLLKPYGDLDFEDAVEVFAKTVRIGVECGVDLILIETMNDSYETKAAVLAAKENCDLPVFVTNAYGADGKLMTGASPAAMVAMLEGLGVDAIGANCSLGPNQLLGVAEELLRYSSLPVILKPNAGLPKFADGVTSYDVDADAFSECMRDLVLNGVRIVGGCCGTTPEYIKKLKERTFDITPVEIKSKNYTFVSSYTNAVFFDKSPVLIGERINPTGKKRVKEALKTANIDFILQEGAKQQECGVHILDVNAGLPEIDEPEMLTRCVCELQSVVDIPLQIDTSDPKAMERALRRYNGKAMVNSVNGKRESMEAIFPLVKKYGGVVVALTLDEGGIPGDVEGRVKIAENILYVAKEYGIKPNDIIFDTLAMTVSAEPTAAKVTLGALEYIKNHLGCHTSLGVSNVSFGLPSREAVNSTFFAAALERGLSAAIMNPFSDEMMRVYYAHRALNALDLNCADYIAYMGTQNNEVKTKESVLDDLATIDSLKQAVQKGLKDRASIITNELLKTIKPLDIVNEGIIPALDVVGRGFEEKTVYLPQLLMSAEAAKEAFEAIKQHMSTDVSAASEKCTVVIATVKGDIHDIGKNIVKLLLENYGFNVIDLGKDVDSQRIVEEVVKTKAPLLALSALMTTTVPAMEETIKEVRKVAPWCKVVVGGAVLTNEYAKRIGADKYGADAMDAVRYAEDINNKAMGN